MSADIRVSVISTPWRLADLERLCAEARTRGLDDDARISYGTSPTSLTVWQPVDDEDNR